MKYNKYGNVAIRALDIFRNEDAESPRDAWDIAVKEIMDKVSMQKKGCPKNAFLGLVGDGEGDNANYAKKARNILKKAIPEELEAIEKMTSSEFWREKISKDKAHNSQMDVVFALWNKI